MDPSTPHLLLVEDDAAFGAVAARALERRGYRVTLAADLAEARAALTAEPPAFAVLDLRLGEESGLALLPELLERAPDCRVVVLTGYASIATAVQAVKLGAANYLAKPVAVDELVAALTGDDTPAPDTPPAAPMSPRRAGWEHVQRVLHEAGGNVSEAARRLGMHRRSLQRMLHKRPPRR